MWKRIVSLLVLLCLVLCLLTLGACSEEERLMEHFPEWEEVDFELFKEKVPVEPEIELEFQGIDFKTYTNSAGEMFDEIRVHFMNTGNKTIAMPENFGIYYFYKDKCYRVYKSGSTESALAILNDSKEDDLSFIVPTGLFDVSGQYVLYYSFIGFCDIDIVFVPK